MFVGERNQVMAHIADIIKYEGDNSTFVWKHPCEDFNSLTQLIVHESQEALFLMNGQALDLFGPGRYTLESQNIPKLGKQFEKTFGGDTPFHCEVYFINKTVQMCLKWGAGDINFIEPSLGFPIKLGVSGELNLTVSDSRKLLTKLIGTMSGIAWDEPDKEKKLHRDELPFAKTLKDTFRPLIATAVKSHLATSIKENNIDLLEIDENLERLSESLRKKILPGFEEYGLSIPQLYIMTVLLPEEDSNFKYLRELHTLPIQKRRLQAEAEMNAAALEAQVAKETAKIEATTAIEKAQAEAATARATARIESEASIHIAKTEAQVKETQAEISKVEADAAKKAAELKASRDNLDIDIEVERRAAERDIIKAQAEAQKRTLEKMVDVDVERAKGLAEAEVERARGLAEAEKMRGMGYTQRDVLQADVQTAYAESLGKMGANSGSTVVVGGNSNGGSGMGINTNGLVNDMVNLGMGMAAAKTVMGPMGEMLNGITNAAAGVTASAQTAPVNNNVTCPGCGSAVPANSKFCPECGNKIEILADDEVVCPVCGKKVKKGKFCLECGAPLINKCSKCGAEVPLGGKFCPECGEKL